MRRLGPTIFIAHDFTGINVESTTTPTTFATSENTCSYSSNLQKRRLHNKNSQQTNGPNRNTPCNFFWKIMRRTRPRDQYSTFFELLPGIFPRYPATVFGCTYIILGQGFMKDAVGPVIVRSAFQLAATIVAKKLAIEHRVGRTNMCLVLLRLLLPMRRHDGWADSEKGMCGLYSMCRLLPGSVPTSRHHHTVLACFTLHTRPPAGVCCLYYRCFLTGTLTAPTYRTFNEYP